MAERSNKFNLVSWENGVVVVAANILDDCGGFYLEN